MILPLLAAMLAVGCAQPWPAPFGPRGSIRIEPVGTVRLDPRRLAEVLADAAAQVRRCYRVPRVGRTGRSVVTRLRVRFSPDGTLAAPPALLFQTGVTQATRRVAGEMAEAARLAIVHCAPLQLPPDAYRGGWDVFDLTFSRSVAA